MANVILRQKAIDDLNSIWDYTFEKWSEKQADKYYATVKMACNGIGDNPDIGTEYYGINKNLLGLKSGKHIIFYQQMSNDRIEIIRILHERMDLKNRIIE
ncbi:type II toxin-antitoxin system RelE/ParE family toxin [Allomuricauda sp. F6463D]|uniref:type II toxin-antitoxin system RelE/ParE family toxin n=1 Tax=Allomuricauda sp. F6463D TaxID=2926409 RepID=UPI001FF344C7|nr:type II toxin-antitoxin system RelE/ParE family toxin [Muricauda sp. F6463D]MCK0162095.1 type II toxin-antitoxin system RelE/ParE family toxin [Muricauda sp. F6463D]